MLGMGFGEIILLGAVALIVIGPEKFPDFAKVVIKTVRDLRGYVDEMKTEVTKELNPIKKELNPLKNELDTLSRIDPEKYIDSLTEGDSETETGASENSSVHEEDQKIMAAADAEAYGEDPYGWEEGEEGDAGLDKGAYPDDTISYGAEDMAEEADEEEESAVASSEELSEESDAAQPEDERVESIDDPTEPDAWT